MAWRQSSCWCQPKSQQQSFELNPSQGACGSGPGGHWRPVSLLREISSGSPHPYRIITCSALLSPRMKSTHRPVLCLAPKCRKLRPSSQVQNSEVRTLGKVTWSLHIYKNKICTGLWRLSCNEIKVGIQCKSWNYCSIDAAGREKGVAAAESTLETHIYSNSSDHTIYFLNPEALLRVMGV